MQFNSDQSKKQRPDGAPNPQQQGPFDLRHIPPEILQQLAAQLGGDREPSAPDLFHFVRQVNSSVDFKETIFNICNEARTAAQVGRVSVVKFHRGKYRIECVSGQPSVNRRSSEIQLLTRLVDKTLRTAQPFAYPVDQPADSTEQEDGGPDNVDAEVPEGFPNPDELYGPDLDDLGENSPAEPISGIASDREAEAEPESEQESQNGDQLPPEIKDPLREYLGKGRARSVLIVPILEEEGNVKQRIEDPSKAKKGERKVLGGLIFEHFDEQKNFDPDETLIHRICEHSADAFRRSQQHQNLFLYPVWRVIGKTKSMAMARRLPVSIIASLVLVALLVLSFWPVDFYVSCKGVIRPVDRDRIYAEEEGRIVDSFAETGKEIKKGDILVRMSSPTLEQNIVSVQGQLASLREEIQYKKGMINANEEQAASVDSSSPLEALYAREKGLIAELANLQIRKDLLVVKAPSDGVVLTWNNDEELSGRPTPKGRMLFETGKLNGKWELELNLPDKRIGHFLSAVKGSKDPLKVDFVLASDPNARYNGVVGKYGNRTQLVQDEGQVLKVTTRFENQAIQVRRAQSEVTAKIYCGRSSLGYLWMHDIVEFAQKRVLFYLW